MSPNKYAHHPHKREWKFSTPEIALFVCKYSYFSHMAENVIEDGMNVIWRGKLFAEIFFSLVTVRIIFRINQILPTARD